MRNKKEGTSQSPKHEDNPQNKFYFNFWKMIFSARDTSKGTLKAMRLGWAGFIAFLIVLLLGIYFIARDVGVKALPFGLIGLIPGIRAIFHKIGQSP